MEVVSVNGRIRVKKLATSILVPVVGGALVGALANTGTREQYDRLKRPSFAPPGWVFPVVWTALYKMMGVAKYRAQEIAKPQGRERQVMNPYELQLGLNFLWSFLFFKWGQRGTALIEMAALLGAIIWAAYEFYQIDKLAGSLMVPYIVWVAFALGLNYSFWQLNK
ncbi:TspO/MBR family protein [Planococcus maritimus]|uniref:TspO/MBR family protein n=1 Tax=Planococcus maritimus TaxID=192421 RepID=UPI00232B1560|nr:TspO/MBR family protein [Planococcus maritimus]